MMMVTSPLRRFQESRINLNSRACFGPRFGMTPLEIRERLKGSLSEAIKKLEQGVNTLKQDSYMQSQALSATGILTAYLATFSDQEKTKSEKDQPIRKTPIF